MGEGSGDDFLIHSLDFERFEGGEETITYPLTITSELTDTDGSESLSFVLNNIPDTAVLSAGTKNEDGSWSVSAQDVSDLTVTVPANAPDFSFDVVATSTEDSNDDSASATASASVDVNVAPVVDGPLNADVLEDASITFTQDQLLAGTSDANGDTLSVQDVTVNNGTLTHNAETNTWTYTPDPDSDEDAVISFNVTDGTEVVANSVAVEVIAVADDPTLSISIGARESSTVEADAQSISVNSETVLVTGNGYTVTAQSINSEGTLSEASADNIGFHNNPQGFGVTGGASGANVELGYSNQHGVSERLSFDFDDDVSSVDVSMLWAKGLAMIS